MKTFSTTEFHKGRGGVLHPVLEQMTCDKCKKVDNDIMQMQEYISIENSCGYMSIIGDGDIIEVDICQHCFKEMFESFYRTVGNYIYGPVPE